MAAKGDRPGSGWFTKREMAAAFDVGVDQFDDAYRRYAPASAVKRVGQALYFHARTVLDGWKAADKGGAVDGDPLLGPVGGDSPALEEYRRYRAGQERIKLAQMEGAMVSVESIKPPLASLAAGLRRAQETVQRQYGNDAVAPLAEALSDFEAGLGQVFGEADEAAAEPAEEEA